MDCSADERLAAPLFVADFGQSPDKVVTVGAGANLTTVPEPRARLRVAADPVRRQAWERKGGPQLLEAFRRVRAERPDAELWIVGPEEAPATEAGVRFSAGSHARAEGERRLGCGLRGRDMFAMPSLYEPFGVVFLEAMAYGLPVRGSDRCAMPEIIEDGVTGHVVDAVDIGTLAQRLLEPRRAGAARAFGEAGHRRFLERYTWDAVAARMDRRGPPVSRIAREPALAPVPELGRRSARARGAARPDRRGHGPCLQEPVRPTSRCAVPNSSRTPAIAVAATSERTSATPSGLQRESTTRDADPEMGGHVDGEREVGADRAGDDPDPRDEDDVDHEVDRDRGERRREPLPRLPEVVRRWREERPDRGRGRRRARTRAGRSPMGVVGPKQQVDDRAGPDERAARAVGRSPRSGSGGARLKERTSEPRSRCRATRGAIVTATTPAG